MCLTLEPLLLTCFPSDPGVLQTNEVPVFLSRPSQVPAVDGPQPVKGGVCLEQKAASHHGRMRQLGPASILPLAGCVAVSLGLGVLSLPVT